MQTPPLFKEEVSRSDGGVPAGRTKSRIKPLQCFDLQIFTNIIIDISLRLYKTLFKPMSDEAIEGFIKTRRKIYQFNSRIELENLLK